MPPRLLLRWTGRDLRRRWVQVGAIALLLAVGIGMYAGLGSTAEWRRASNDASYEQLRMHDLRVALGPGSVTPQGSLAAVAAGLGDGVAAVEERLILPTQVRAQADTGEVLVRGQVVGVDVAGGGPEVNQVHVYEGRGLDPGHDGQPVVLLERSFALHHGLPAEGELHLSGGRRVSYRGHATMPEHFFVLGDGLELFAQANYAVLFAPLGSVQAIAGAAVVNDLVLRVGAGVDAERLHAQLVRALDDQLPDVSATVTTREEDPAYHLLYEDIANDQKIWNLVAFLILGGATLATFNLASRVAEAQRREIGVGMAMGARPAVLAVRPVLFGVQVGLLGVLGGVAVGLAATAGMRGLLDEFLPLPVWVTGFQTGLFAQAAALGLLLPVLATAYPVWRAVRVEPVEAMRHVAVGRGGAARLAARLPLPGRTVGQVPLRNLLRNPRRTVLTAVAIGAALTTLVGIVGILDTFDRTITDYGDELAGEAPGRVTATLAGVVAEDGPEIEALRGLPGVTAVEPSVRLPGSLHADGVDVPVVVDLVDPAKGLWSPSVQTGSGPHPRGLVLARKAASDLGVDVGDPVVLRHPQRRGEGAFGQADTTLRVSGIHPGPFRFAAYLSADAAERFGLAGAANVAHVLPEAGADEPQLRRALFEAPGVASVAPAGAAMASFEEALDLVTGVLTGAVLAALVLALLIAFNTASISADERAREHATMLAFGMRTRSVLRLLTVESALLGLLGTVVGLAAGLAVLRWEVGSLLPDTMPEFAMTAYLAPRSVAMVVGVGMLAVGIAPLLTLRKLRRMDIPSTLRLLE